MRTLFLSLLCLFGALTVLQAQDPGIAYQAVARDADGDPLADAELDVRVTLYGSDDAVLWQESHASVLTNQFGNLALTFGDGAVTPGFGALGAVDWSAAGLHFGIEVDAGAGYASFGDVDVQAVPIAMYALNGQEEEIAALQTQLDNLDGDVSALASDLSDAIGAVSSDLSDAVEASESEDAYLLGLIQANDGEISVLQSSVAANTADLGDLLSVISVNSTGITVEDLTITGDLDITGVFGAATGLFNYLSANNADFEDMIAEAAQVEQLTFFDGHALGTNSILDIDGTLNVDGATTMNSDLTVNGTIYNNGAELATVPYVDAGDATNAQAIADEADARSDADDALQLQVTSNDGDISALQAADVLLQGNINAVQADVDANETVSNDADAAIQADVDANEIASDDADAALQADVDANELASDNAEAAIQADVDANEIASNDADAAIQSDVDANEIASNDADAAIQSDVDANEIASNDADAAIQSDVDANEIASNDADAAIQSDVDANETASDDADAALQGQITSNDEDIADNASDIDDNEFRIAATAADMGFSTSTVGTVNNIPQHPGYAGAEYLSEDDDLVEADFALDAALEANADADAALAADVDANEIASNDADAAIQSDVDANEICEQRC